MKTTLVITLSLFLGIGVIGVQTIHAQDNPPVPVYMIVDNDIQDPEGYTNQFLPLIQRTIKAHGGWYIAAGTGTALDGAPPKGRVAIVQWDSLEQFQNWRNSPEYKKAKEVGEKYATFRVFIVKGTGTEGH